MTDKTDTPADCYSAAERSAMQWTQRLRRRLFDPLLGLLVFCRVTPDGLTLLSLLAGLSFCPLYFCSKAAALGMLALHVFLDGLDGPLARHTGVASRRGSFTDTSADQVVVVTTTAMLMSTGVVGVWPGAVYIFAYTVVVVFAMVRNALAIPYCWLVRPRFIVYVWLIVEIYLLPGTIDYVLWTSNAMLSLKVLSGFARIRGKI